MSIIKIEEIIVDSLHHLSKENLPCHFIFDIDWKIIYNCPSCKHDISISNRSNNFTSIQNINSKYYSNLVLKEIVDISQNLEIIKINHISYINRTDFNYKYDFQRELSTEFKYHNCNNCHLNYLSLIRIGLPQDGERGKPSLPGKVEVIQITALPNTHILIQELINQK